MNSNAILRKTGQLRAGHFLSILHNCTFCQGSCDSYFFLSRSIRSRRGHLPDTVLWDSITWKQRLSSSMTQMTHFSPSTIEGRKHHLSSQFFPRHVCKNFFRYPLSKASNAQRMTDLRIVGTVGTIHSGTPWP